VAYDGGVDPNDRPFSPIFLGSTQGFWNDVSAANVSSALPVNPRGQVMQFITPAHALAPTRPSRTSVASLVSAPTDLAAASPFLYWEWATEDCADPNVISAQRLSGLDLPAKLSKVSLTTDTACAFRAAPLGTPAFGELRGGAIVTGDWNTSLDGRLKEATQLGGFRGQGAFVPSGSASIGVVEGVCGAACLTTPRAEFSVEGAFLAGSDLASSGLQLLRQPGAWALRLESGALHLLLTAKTAAGGVAFTDRDIELGPLSLVNGKGRALDEQAVLWRHVGVSVNLSGATLTVRAWVDGVPLFAKALPAQGAVRFEGTTYAQASLLIGPGGPTPAPAATQLFADEVVVSKVARTTESMALGAGGNMSGIRNQFLNEAEVRTFFRLLHVGDAVRFERDAAGLPTQVAVSELRVPAEFRPFVTGAASEAQKAQRLRRLVDVGRALFQSDVLSFGKDGLKQLQLGTGAPMKCSTCHALNRAFTDGRTTARGTADGPLNSPTIVSRVLARRDFFNRRAEDLVEQALMPVRNPIEMNGDVPTILARLGTDAAYASLKSGLEAAFAETALTASQLAVALTAFEITQLSNANLAERIARGKYPGNAALVRRGKFVFENKARCTACHVGPNFSDELMHDTGVEAAEGQFKTPTLWRIAETGPYFHDGRTPTLEAVVDFYDEGFVARRSKRRPMDAEMRPLGLSSDEKAALVAYLRSIKPSPGAVRGVIDGIDANRRATGWACVENHQPAISVEVYAGSALLAVVPSSDASGDAVARECGTGQLRHRFHYDVPVGQQRKLLRVLGRHPDGVTKTELARSGQFVIP
jgi:cytochrome c peroxidase